MADLSITAASVVYVSGSVDKSKNAGATITAGQTVYLDSDTDTWKLCDSDSSATTAACAGVALHGSLSGQPLAVQTDGVITIGATLVQGNPYYTSDTAGGIKPVADMDADDYVCLLGVAISTTNLQLILNFPGVLWVAPV